jgi:hypothetical protein
MKIWFGLLLSLLLFMAGCASGYYETRPGNQEEVSKYWQDILSSNFRDRKELKLGERSTLWFGVDNLSEDVRSVI